MSTDSRAATEKGNHCNPNCGFFVLVWCLLKPFLVPVDEL